jgi:hypothetical protein
LHHRKTQFTVGIWLNVLVAQNQTTHDIVSHIRKLKLKNMVDNCQNV